MSSAAVQSDERVRQIAILVSSVDAATARSLLLHLPTQLAKQVRDVASRLGPISRSEKQKILAEFQRSSAAPPSTDRAIRAQTEASSAAARPAPTPHTAAVDAALNASAKSSSVNLEPPSEEETAGPSWTKLSAQALVRFLKTERDSVVAVVVAQLPPRKAVEVLQLLPVLQSDAVIRRLSTVQDIDPEAMAAIDEHLSQSLGEYQHRIESENENNRRIQALLAVAPPSLQSKWSALLAAPESDESNTQPVATETTRASVLPEQVVSDNAAAIAPQATLDQLYVDAVITTATNPMVNQSLDELDISSQAQSPDILPFVRPDSAAQSESLSGLELRFAFEQLLALPPVHIADLLSSTDTETVRLALAGATPEFMKRFLQMLEPADARALTKHLSSLGTISLRDVDEAQRRIATKVKKWSRTVPQLRAA